MTISFSLSVLLLAFAPQAEPFFHPKGSYPTIHPRASDVLRDDFIVHQDTTGGGRQELLALSAGPGGAAAIWQDGRDGNVALYMGFVDGEGVALGGDMPLNPPRTSRHFRPAVTIGPDFKVAAAWHYTDPGRQQVYLRFHQVGGRASREPQRIGTPSGHSVTGIRGGSKRTASDHPALALDASGAGWLAWIESERVHAKRLRAGGRLGASLGAIDERAPAALGDLRLAVAPDGETALAWRSAKGVVFSLLNAAGRAQSAVVGSGTPWKLVSARGGGWWLLTYADSGLALYELTAEGAPAGQVLRPITGTVRSADLCSWSGTPTLAVEREPSRGEALELHFLDAEGASRFGGLPLADEAAVNPRGPRVAALESGALLLAWTDDREGNADVWYRLLQPGEGPGARPEYGPARRWNGDGPSSDQLFPSVDATGGHGLFAWQDLRSGEARIWARRLDRDGQFDGDEFELSGGTSDGSQAWKPTVSLAEDGSFFAVWKLRRPGEPDSVLVGRLFGPGQRALGPVVQLDGGRRASSGWPCAVARHPDGGWTLVWVRLGAGVFTRRVGVDASLGPINRLGREEGGSAGNPAVAALQGGGAASAFVAAWDLRADDSKQSVLRGRVFGPDGDARGERELSFPVSGRGGDLDPALAPAPEGGFLLTWTGNDGPPRDIFARWFAVGGRPRGPLLPISVRANEQDYSDVALLRDGSWVVAWEDDISGRDHTLARRIAPDASSTGPAVTLNQREALFVETRTAPRLAAFGDGFLAAWGDRRRSLGHDVFAAVFGARFDSVDEPARNKAKER